MGCSSVRSASGSGASSVTSSSESDVATARCRGRGRPGYFPGRCGRGLDICFFLGWSAGTASVDVALIKLQVPTLLVGQMCVRFRVLSRVSVGKKFRDVSSVELFICDIIFV